MSKYFLAFNAYLGHELDIHNYITHQIDENLITLYRFYLAFLLLKYMCLLGRFVLFSVLL